MDHTGGDYVTEEIVTGQLVEGMMGDAIIYEDGSRANAYDDEGEEGPSETPNETFHTLCGAIDPSMDPHFKLECWRLYQRVYGQCCLEGSEVPWLAASIYANQQIKKSKKQVPVMASKFKYPLCRILEAASLSAIEFFDRLTRFAEMVNGPTCRLLNQCRRIQASLAVSAVVFKKYLPIFRRVFARPESTSPDDASPNQLFKLIWHMFLVLRRQLSSSGSEDLLICFHLLLCCVDAVARDLVACGVQQGIHEDFVEEASDCGEAILGKLCRLFEGVMLDAKHFKAHWFEKNLGEHISLRVPLDFNANCEQYLSELDVKYEEQLLTRGEYDERLFVPENIDLVYDAAYDTIAIELLRRCEHSEWSVDSDLLLRMSTQACLEKVDKVKATPLSGKAYIMSSEQFCQMTPSADASLSPQRLMALVPDGWSLADSELSRCFSEFRDNPINEIAMTMEAMGASFEHKVHEERTTRGENYDAVIAESVHKHRDLAAHIFWRLLEKIILFERDRVPVAYRAFDFTAIVRKDEFIGSLFALSLELVLVVYRSERAFPWVLGAVSSAEMGQSLPAVHFYKIIEVVVRSESGLSREMVKHLNTIEEQVLEELAWSLDSPLWTLLARRADGVPSCDRVWNSDMRAELYSPAKRRRMEDDGESVPPSGVLTLFFRKIYFLASIRLTDLCDRLKMDEKARCKVWTLVEYFLRTETSLMAGRHLDQNLMCCVYMTCRHSGLEITFNQIMQHYKQQPQASNRVYRNVLVERTGGRNVPRIYRNPPEVPQKRNPKVEGASEAGQSPQEAPPTHHEAPQHEFVDVITYYNRVFIPRMGEFVKRLESADGGSLLLPLPVLRPFALTPHKRIISDRISVQPLAPPITATSRSGPFGIVGGSRIGGKAAKPLTRFVPIAPRPASYYQNQVFRVNY